jgi:hypothetical protein
MLEKHASGASLTNIPLAPTPAVEEMARDADVEGDALVLHLSSGLAPVFTPLIARCSLADQRVPPIGWDANRSRPR